MTLFIQIVAQGAVGFAIGAGTNELAIRWVFNALFTKKKRLIAERMKNLISTELMTSEKIAAKMSSSGVKGVFERDVRRQLDEFDRKTKSLLGCVVGKGLDQVLPELVKDEVRAFAKVADLFDDDLRETIARICANQISHYLADNLPRFIGETDVWNIVYETIMAYDEKKLEVLAREIANRELHGVTLWGGVIGAIVGVSMSVVLWLIG